MTKTERKNHLDYCRILINEATKEMDGKDSFLKIDDLLRQAKYHLDKAIANTNEE